MRPIILFLMLLTVPASRAGDEVYRLFARTNLMAWCIVPFDAKKRGPEERAEMLQKLGFGKFAYDYRAEHIPTFDAEVEACRRRGIELSAWWFPTELNAEAKQILAVLKRHKLHSQLWVMGGGGPVKTPEEQTARVESEAKRIKPIAEAAGAIRCSVSLYNHGGWFGEPDNQIAIIGLLRQQGVTNVHIVYNLHHGHDHVDAFPGLLARMKPHLAVININGTARNGDKLGKKIIPLGLGELDLPLLKTIRDSGWHGPIGILNHTDEDAEARLADNLDGLDQLVARLDGTPAPVRPALRSWREPVR